MTTACASPETGRRLGSRFVAHNQSSRCSFDVLEGVLPADAAEGGLAKLFTAALPDGTIVAVKRFHAVRGFDEDSYARQYEMARAEYRKLLDLDGASGHAPFAYALGACIDENGCEHAAIAMEYVDGYTLEYALQSGMLRSGSRTQDTFRLGAQVTQALLACGGCVHRDLSPRNIMLVMNEDGTVHRAVLIDFGQAASAYDGMVTPAAGPHRLATVSFGAPEVFGGAHYGLRNEPSVDVYSFGALLYYLRARRIPLAGLVSCDATSRQGSARIVEAKLEPLDLAAALGPSLRAAEHALVQLVRSCTAFDPRERPSMQQVADTIQQALGDEPQTLLKRSDDYFYGHGGLRRDTRKSYDALVSAARMGSAEAQFKLGRSLALGHHGNVALPQARTWLDKAARAGHPGAASTL
ncbi:MAG: protein kinase, partial [Eggerthellaceae bacterium]|nr:protein kinase [Eggerthellaceae bacterium]